MESSPAVPLQLTETNLEASRTSDIHRGRLKIGWQILIRYLVSVGLHNDSNWLRDELWADQVLVNFINFCHDNNAIKLWKARMGLLAAQTTWRFLRHKLPRSWDAIQSWQQKVPTTNRLPLPQDILHALVLCALSLAFGRERHQELCSFAMVCLVGLYGVLRPTEILLPMVGDLRLSTRKGETCLHRGYQGTRG